MERYTAEQRVLIVKTHYKNGECYAQTVRRLRALLGRNNAPNESTVRRLITKFEATGNTANIPTPERTRRARSVQNIAIVRDSVQMSPNKSIRRRSQQLGISRSSLQRILVKDLHMHAFRVQLTQELKPTDHLQRRQFVQWILERQHADHNFANKIIFSDEAHFHLSGFVNKQNCRIWGTENPKKIIEKGLHPQRVTVWCGLWAGGVIGPYFFEDEDGNATTINGERYRNMVRNFLWPYLDNIDYEQLWFQQDGATCHTSNETLHLLHEKFPNRVLSRRGDQNWPPRSCDLTPCDFFLWGFLKSQVYEHNPRTIQDLKQQIRRVSAEIQPQDCAKVITNFMDRVTSCRASRGGHMPDIIFHT